MMNFELMKRLKEQGLSQKKFAPMVGELESTVSHVVNGRWVLTADEQKKYAEALGCKVEDIFKLEKEKTE